MGKADVFEYSSFEKSRPTLFLFQSLICWLRQLRKNPKNIQNLVTAKRTWA